MVNPRGRFEPTPSHAGESIQLACVTASSLLLLVLFLGFVPTALASSNWYVDGVNGSDDNDCKSPQTACKTIGHAISLASSGDFILIAAATYPENLAINISLKLLGSDASTTIIDGQANGNVIYIINTVNVTVAKLTIRNGAGGSGAGISFTYGTLAISDCVISGNLAKGRDVFGGGVFNYQGTVTINNSAINGNRNEGYGAGLGGGVNNFVGGTMTISNSTISGNVSPSGGGIENVGTLTINNSTISGNTALIGGGIDNETLVTINNSTISNNSAKDHGRGGGIADEGNAVIIRNSIVANSPSGGNCYGGPTSAGHNLSDDKTCNFFNRGDLNNTDPKLGRLENNGGPTQTHALLSGSPAIDAGNPKGCTDGHGHLLKTDQRGKPRPDKEDKSGCDMGAYERQSD
jgi:hypothetical protein